MKPKKIIHESANFIEKYQWIIVPPLCFLLLTHCMHKENEIVNKKIIALEKKYKFPLEIKPCVINYLSSYHYRNKEWKQKFLADVIEQCEREQYQIDQQNARLSRYER